MEKLKDERETEKAMNVCLAVSERKGRVRVCVCNHAGVECMYAARVYLHHMRKRYTYTVVLGKKKRNVEIPTCRYIQKRCLRTGDRYLCVCSVICLSCLTCLSLPCASNLRDLKKIFEVLLFLSERIT
ncbi:hypothetical protein CSUI_008281, partial [Cystoisospora suis]